MANLTYTADILSDALFRAGEATDASSDYYGQALVYLNTVYMQICRGGAELTPSINEDWAWLQKSRPGVLTLRPALTGTCAVAQDSTTVTLSASQSTDLLNYYFLIQGHPDVFRVATHGGGTAVVLDAVYTGTTDSAATYAAFALEYDLASDVMRVTAPMRCYVSSQVNNTWSRYQVYRAASDSLDVWSAVNGDTGVPDLFAEIGPVTAGVKRVRFNRYLGSSYTKLVRVEYEYLYRPTALTAPGTTEEPVLPLEWRHLLSDYTLAYLFGQKNDDRAGGAAQAAQAGLMGMAKENRYKMTTATHNLFRIRPRSFGLGRVLRTETGQVIA